MAEPRRILFNQGPTLVAGAFKPPSLQYAEPGISTDQYVGMIGTGTSNPHVYQLTHSTIVVDYSDTPGVIQRRVMTTPLSTVSAPAFQTNNKNAQPSGICEPSDGDVGIVVKGVLIGRFTPTGLVLTGSLTYTSGGGVILSFGTTAQRPVSPTHGFIWHNTTLGHIEYWDGDSWEEVGSGGGGSALSPWVTKTANYTLQAGERIIANTDGGAFTLTLPAAPTHGTEVWIMGDWAVRNLTIGRNGKQIFRKAENHVANKDNIGYHLVYDNDLGNWRNFT